jgi:hypothetical protein
VNNVGWNGAAEFFLDLTPERWEQALIEHVPHAERERRAPRHGRAATGSDRLDLE